MRNKETKEDNKMRVLVESIQPFTEVDKNAEQMQGEEVSGETIVKIFTNFKKYGSRYELFVEGEILK